MTKSFYQCLYCGIIFADIDHTKDSHFYDDYEYVPSKHVTECPHCGEIKNLKPKNKMNIDIYSKD